MSLDADAIYHAVTTAGEDWADKKSAFEALDDLTKTILSDVISDYLPPTSATKARARDGKGKANGDFVVALVNWFRANHASLRAGQMNNFQDLP